MVEVDRPEEGKNMKNYGCRARIMEGPNFGIRCGEDCIIIVDKSKKSKRHSIPSGMDIFLYPHKRGRYCQYHERLRKGRFEPYFPDSKLGVVR